MKLKKLAMLTIMISMFVALGSVAANCSVKFDPEKSPLVIATQELDGLFSPFYSTTGADSGVVGMTQISMLTVDEKGGTEYGDDVSTVVRYASELLHDERDDIQKANENGRYPEDYYTEYEYVIKNGILFSDGEELNIEDVLFNLYMYLDPVYNGSNTLYSTDILGLSAYRTQVDNEDSSSFEKDIQEQALARVRLFLSYYNPNRGVGFTNEQITQLEADYEALKVQFYEEELNSDWSAFASNLESLIDEYRDINEKQTVSEVWEVYLLNWSVVRPKYDEIGDDPTEIISIDFGRHKDNINKIKSDNKKKSAAEVEALIKKYCMDTVFSNYFSDVDDLVFNAKAEDFIYYTATGNGYQQYVVNQIKSANLQGSDREFKNVSGISIYTIPAGETFTDNIQDASQAGGSKTYTLTEPHDVLKVRIYGVDPKAFMNFGFTVAPMHYYSNPKSGSGYTAQDGYAGFSYENNHFGFPYADINYMNKVVRDVSKLPMGAGTYQASNSRHDSDFSKVTALGTTTGFYDSNIVYYVRNENFETTSTSPDVHNAIIRNVRLAVTNQTRLFDAVKTDTVHFSEPSAKQKTMNELENHNTRGSLRYAKARTNGYGYIGLNAKFVKNIDIRRAIMFAMDTSLVTQYYPTELVDQIFRPISMASWAYPESEDAKKPYYNSYEGSVFSNTLARTNIIEYRNRGGYDVPGSGGVYQNASGDSLKYTFTIAGGNTDHPAYLTMRTAADLLNECGFDIKVVTDPFALRKLTSGRLTVWAAAWSSGIDPDMFQVYHKDSQATSIVQWGYPSMLGIRGEEGHNDQEELGIIDDLSELIDDARKITGRPERTAIYAEALDLIMELAVELPTYQRYDLYVYKNTIIDESTLISDCTPFRSPLSEMWKVNFVQ